MRTELKNVVVQDISLLEDPVYKEETWEYVEVKKSGDKLEVSSEDMLILLQKALPGYMNSYNIIARAFDRQDFLKAYMDAMFKGEIDRYCEHTGMTDEEVMAAAKAAHADHFIRTLPGGYQMELNEDASNVSQGQKQLLTIARAILADNRVLILDEATSSVDTRTEERIQRAMDHLMEGRTSFIIAHRLSTIRNADLILVMKEGDIVEQGSHTALLAAGGFYAALYHSQFEDIE